jgi:hypothetical protein
MKPTTFLLTFLGFVTVALALPLSDSDAYLAERDQSLEERSVDTHNPAVYARYFGTTYEIAERDYDAEDLEARQEAEVAEGVVDIVETVIKTIEKIFSFIAADIAADRKKRENWLSSTIDKLRAKHPHFNFVLVDSKHKINFQGVQGKDWGHKRHTLGISFGRHVGYDIYWFKAGTFILLGDGGFENWSFSGALKSRTGVQGKVLVFNAPN